MPEPIRAYVRLIDRVNRWVGLLAMYMIFVMMAVLLYSPVKDALLSILGLATSKSGTFYDEVAPLLFPPAWAFEMSQFLMVAYFLLGGGYSMQLASHVRMDLFYGNWTPRTRSIVDTVTILFLIFYLILLLYGGFSSTQYALQYGETSYSSWSPYMAPIKIVMCFGIALMLLQAIAMFFRNLAEARGRPLDDAASDEEAAA